MQHTESYTNSPITNKVKKGKNNKILACTIYRRVIPLTKSPMAFRSPKP